jgi:hypothetical protein
MAARPLSGALAATGTISPDRMTFVNFKSGTAEDKTSH